MCTRPRFVSPWEQYNTQFVQNVRVGDVEVVLENRHGEKSVKVFLNIFASHGSHMLSELNTHLCGSIVHDRNSACAGKSTKPSPTLLLPSYIAACSAGKVILSRCSTRLAVRRRRSSSIRLRRRRLNGRRCESLVPATCGRLQIGRRSSSTICPETVRASGWLLRLPAGG